MYNEYNTLFKNLSILFFISIYFILFLHSLNQLFECVQISGVGIDVEKMAFAVDEEVGGIGIDF